MAAPKGNKYAVGNPNSGRPLEWTDERIAEESAYLIEWAHKDDSIVLGQCYGMRGYSYVDAMEWEEKHEVFRKAKRQAMTIVGSRREAGGVKNKYDSAMIRCTMPMYDPAYKAWLKEIKRAEILEDIVTEEQKKNLSDKLKAINNVKS